MNRSAAVVLANLLLLSCGEPVIRVACVGDSITFGGGIEDRVRNAFPAVLARLLGPSYSVRNFGVPGATLLKRGNVSYWIQPELREAIRWDPDIVVIALGTNDTKPVNWQRRAEIPGDARFLIRYFRAEESRTKVIWALPPKILKNLDGINEKNAVEEAAILRRVALEEGCEVVDLHDQLATGALFNADGVHPNLAGARKIAHLLRPVIVRAN